MERWKYALLDRARPTYQLASWGGYVTMRMLRASTAPAFEMHTCVLLICGGLSLALLGCVSRVEERAAERESIRLHLQQLEEDQPRMLSEVNDVRQRLDQLKLEKQRKAEARPGYPGVPVVVEAKVISLTRSAPAPFRFWGRLRLEQPEGYRGKEVEGFLVSHERDLTTLVGQTITVATLSGVLTQELEPMGPFSINNHSTLVAEDEGGRFLPFDEARYVKPIALSGRIDAYEADPEQKSGYFILEMMFSGSMATVLINSPQRYRGTKLRVLAEHNDRDAQATWSKVGNEVAFSTTEAIVTWEPWGFTRAADLKDVTLVQ